MRENGFLGESVTDGRVIMVKTHYWDKAEKNSYQKAVILIRSPYDTLKAEFKRRGIGEHTSQITIIPDDGKYIL